MAKKLVKKKIKMPTPPTDRNSEGCVVPLAYKTGKMSKKGLCNQPIYLYWTVQGTGGGICYECHDRHCDENDSFSLHEAFGLTKPTTGFDRFGFERARDERQVRTVLEAPVKAKRTVPKKTVEYTKVQGTADDIVDDILAGLL